MGAERKKNSRISATETAPRQESKTKSERPPSQAEFVGKLIGKMEARLEKDEVKATLGEFIRLLQLQKELQEEQPREIKVQWVEPSKEELVGK